MADNDIQFLGNWNAKQTSSSNDFISAIVLTPIDGTDPRTFSRSHTSLVNIGRIPASEVDRNSSHSAATEENARFTNPVMSRNHAKITFADSGSAFIIDTNSHHGTWVRRSMLPNPEIKLAPESPYMLFDGDTVTFGKDVTKNGVVHQPLAVTIKLLRANSMINQSPAVSSVTCSEKVASPKPRNRFGLDSSYDSDSHDSDASDSEVYDIYSDNVGENDEHCAGSNPIPIQFPLNKSRSKSSERGRRSFVLDSPSSEPSSIASSSSSTRDKSTTPQHSLIHITPGPADLLDGASNTLRRESPLSEQQALSLELSGTGVETNNVNISGIVSVTQKTPPWRRAGALLSAVHQPDTGGISSPPRQIGRFLNPLWMRSQRTGICGHSPFKGAQYPSTYLLSGAGCVGTSGGRVDRSTQENCHEGHEHWQHLHESHAHSARRDLDRSSCIRRGDVTVAIEEEEPSVKRLHETLSTRVEDLARQLTAVQDSVHTLGSHTLIDQISTFKFTLETLETAVTALQTDVAAAQADISTTRVDIDMLRVDVATLRTSYNSDIISMKENATSQGTELKLLRDDLRKFQAGVSDIARNLETIAGDIGPVRVVHDDVRRDILRLEEGLARVDSLMKELSSNLEVRDETTQRDIMTEVHQLLKEALPERRKRGRDEAFSGDDNTVEVISTASRPSKRLRVVADLATAGIVGAFGAYLGLAYLQV